MAGKNLQSRSRNPRRAAERQSEDDDWQQVNVSNSLVSPGGGPLRMELSGSSRKFASRGELLSIVRKHSRGIGRGTNNTFEPDEEVDRQFWQELLDMFFVRGLVDVKSEKSDQDDDLVFFVRLEGVQTGNGTFNDSGDPLMQPFFVSRWAPHLRSVIGNNAWEVDWRRSFFLNLIAHTSFSLTIAICSRQALFDHQQSSKTLTPLYKVTKTVYASPSRTNFQRDSKATETVAAYPDICFVVDDYDDTFNQVVITDVDHCYCVLLNACGGAAFPTEDNQESAPARTSHEAQMLGEAPQGSSSPMVTLFSGFVNYDMVRSAFEVGRRPTFDDIFQKVHHLKSEKLIMRGPGGRGEVEVAVSAVTSDQQGTKQVTKLAPSQTKPAQKPGLGSIMRKAAEVASTVAKNVAIVTADGKFDNGIHSPLRCCLMTLSLPWDTIARDLLFKELSEHAL